MYEQTNSMLEESLVPLFYPYTLAKFLSSNGIAVDKVLQKTNISHAELGSLDTRVSQTIHARLLSNAQKAWGRPGLGLAFGGSLRLQSLGMIGIAARASRTLGEALDTLVKYLAIRSPLLSYHCFRDNDGSLNYSLKGTRDLGENERFMIEAGLAATRSFLQQLSAKELSSLAFSLKRQPEGELGLYREALGNNIEFGSNTDGFQLPASIANLALTTRHQLNEEEARRYCDAEIANIGKETGFKKVIYDLICSKLRSSPKETDAATLLGCSPRSLRRRLATQKTTFRELLISARCDTAKRLLHTSYLSIEEIAYEVGYVNVGNFSRAFKVWTGYTPSAYRRQAH